MANIFKKENVNTKHASVLLLTEADNILNLLVLGNGWDRSEL